MAASVTVPQPTQGLNSAARLRRPMRLAHGVVTLSGHGLSVRVDRGHLVLQDSTIDEQYEARLPRVGHGLRRLIVIGSDGVISLAALRWLRDQKTAFLLLDRDGSVLTATGPSQLRDSRLRRAQAVAGQTDQAVRIARVLITQKLAAQERLARQTLQSETVASGIAAERQSLSGASTIEAIRWTEARGALAYWSAWRDIPVVFPKAALGRVPEHWRTFGVRRSPLTGSPRLAVNPPNAMLNYLYALVESEARLACVAVGLDPNLGFLHADTDSRASLACDLMETVRPQVDAYVLSWITREPLRREWFFEQRNGNCRLMAPFARQLSETMATWAQAVAPVAERVAAILRESIPGAKGRRDAHTTPLTERHRREAKGAPESAPRQLPRPPRVCPSCGQGVKNTGANCRKCANAELSLAFPTVLAKGRTVAQSPAAQAKRSETRRKNAEAVSKWNPVSLPPWLTMEFYEQEVAPRLRSRKSVEVARCLKVSESYAAQVKSGVRIPHPRHWLSLAELLRITIEAHREDTQQ